MSREKEKLITLDDREIGEWECTKDELINIVTERGGEGFDQLHEMGGVTGLMKRLKVDPDEGIDDSDLDDIAERKVLFGKNKFKEKPPKSFLAFLWESFIEDKILILLACAAVVSIGLEMGLGHDRSTGWIEGTAILIAVALVAFVTAGNDYSKDRQFRQLSAVTSDLKIKVRRGGKYKQVSTYDLLVGDIISLETGDKIPADSILIEGHSLSVDESAMTGEPMAIHKGEEDPFFLSSCAVMSGVGKMVVVAVGMSSQWGIIKSMLENDEEKKTPLQEKLDGLAELIGKLGLGAAVVIFVALVLKWAITEYAIEENKFEGEDLRILVHFVIISITVIVVAVPEGLPLAVTISLAYSMFKMMKDQNLVRHLAACETMGGATQICSDKTGTLTQNRMKVVQAWIGDVEYNYEEQDPNKNDLHKTVHYLLTEGMCVNSSAYIQMQEKGLPDFIGNKTECALLVYSRLLGVDYDEVRKDSVIEKLYPFSSSKKRMSTLIKTDDGHRLYVKGAAEVVLDFCDQYLTKDGEVKALDKAKKRKLLQEIENLASEGLRTLTLGYREFAGDINDIVESSDDESGEGGLNATPLDKDLILIGVVGIEDPLRPEVPDAVRQCKKAGITVRMLTGDNILTAKNIARRCGILTKDGKAMEGPKFRKLDKAELDAIWPKLQVVARCSPVDKHDLVKYLREKGEVVAVTGDGTNDAPQLMEADVGFSMGISGTEVAKQASDIILLDDNFRSIVNAVMWGRNVYDSIRKFIQFQLTINVVAVLTVFVGGITEGDSPLTAVQLLWVNLIMDTMAALALATEAPTRALLDRPPHGRNSPLITKRMWRFIFGCALYQLTATAIILYLARDWAWLQIQDEEELNTVIFNAFVFCQIFNEFNARKLGDELNMFSGLWGNWIFIGVIGGTVIVQALIVEFGGRFTSTKPLSVRQWEFCIAVGAGMLPWSFLLRFVRVPDEDAQRRKELEKESLIKMEEIPQDEDGEYSFPRRRGALDNWALARNILTQTKVVAALRRDTHNPKSVDIGKGKAKANGH